MRDIFIITGQKNAWELTIFPNEFFPCSVARMKKLLKCVNMSTKPKDSLAELCGYLYFMGALLSANYKNDKLVKRYEKLYHITKEELDKWVDL